MKPPVFIDLPRNPPCVDVVNDGGENGNGVSDGGHFLTAPPDNRLALMGYRAPSSPLGVFSMWYREWTKIISSCTVYKT